MIQNQSNAFPPRQTFLVKLLTMAPLFSFFSDRKLALKDGEIIYCFALLLCDIYPSRDKFSEMNA